MHQSLFTWYIHYMDRCFTADFPFKWIGCGMKSDFGTEFPSSEHTLRLLSWMETKQHNMRNQAGWNYKFVIFLKTASVTRQLVVCNSLSLNSVTFTDVHVKCAEIVLTWLGDSNRCCNENMPCTERKCSVRSLRHIIHWQIMIAGSIMEAADSWGQAEQPLPKRLFH